MIPLLSGKSTLFNMLTGMCSSSSGSAAIFGYDINDPDQMAEIRKMTGICPQHDILFDEITPREHLTYFARIRASSRIRTKNKTFSLSAGSRGAPSGWRG